MFATRKQTITLFIKITLLALFTLESLHHFRGRTGIHARVLVAFDGPAKVARNRIPPLLKPRYTRWWRALLLLGRYWRTRLP